MRKNNKTKKYVKNNKKEIKRNNEKRNMTSNLLHLLLLAPV
jgi:hypothetical protein